MNAGPDRTNPTPKIQIRGLKKAFGPKVVLDGLDLRQTHRAQILHFLLQKRGGPLGHVAQNLLPQPDPDPG